MAAEKAFRVGIIRSLMGAGAADIVECCGGCCCCCCYHVATTWPRTTLRYHMSTQLATIKQLYLGTYLIRKLDLNSKPKQLLVAIVRNVLGLDN